MGCGHATGTADFGLNVFGHELGDDIPIELGGEGLQLGDPLLVAGFEKNGFVQHSTEPGRSCKFSYLNACGFNTQALPTAEEL